MRLFVINHQRNNRAHWVTELSRILEERGFLTPEYESPLTNNGMLPAVCFVHLNDQEEQERWAEYANQNRDTCFVVYCSSVPAGAKGAKSDYAPKLENVFAMELDGNRFIADYLDAFIFEIQTGVRPDFSLLKEEKLPESTIAAYLLEKAEMDVSSVLNESAIGDRHRGETSHAAVLKRYFGRFS